jgi:hypothetical protein
MEAKSHNSLDKRKSLKIRGLWDGAVAKLLAAHCTYFCYEA